METGRLPGRLEVKGVVRQGFVAPHYAGHADAGEGLLQRVLEAVLRDPALVGVLITLPRLSSCNTSLEDEFVGVRSVAWPVSATRNAAKTAVRL